MSYSDYPKTTRLRFVSSPDADMIPEYFDALGVRVQIYGNPVWESTEKRWFVWFVPDDKSPVDIASVHL